MKKLFFVSVVMVASIGSATISVDAKKNGGVVLSKESLRSVGKVQCGKVRGAWIAGTHLPRNRFLSHQAQSESLFAKASKAQRSSKSELLREAKRLKKLSKSQTRRCRALNVPRGYRRPLFNLDRSVTVGLRLKKQDVRKSSTSGLKELVSIDDSGAAVAALTAGDPKIKRMYSTSSGRLFLYTEFDVVGTEVFNYCVLYEVNRWNGTMNCVDRQAALFNVDDEFNEAMYSPVQVDASGALYYGASTRNYPNEGKGIKRQYRGKTSWILQITGSSQLTFIALPDGRVIASKREQEGSPGTWTRLYYPSGRFDTLLKEEVGPMKIFPDGNVYFTSIVNHNFGMMRFLTESNTMDSKFWISGSGCIQAITECRAYPDAHHVRSFSESPAQESKWIASRDTTMFALQFNQDPDLLSWCYGCKFPGWANRLYRLFLDPRPITTSLAHVEDGVAIEGGLVLSGETAPGQFATILYNTATGAETVLVGPDRLMRLEFLTYVKDSESVVYYGQDMKSKQWISGVIDLVNNTVKISSRSTTPLSNMQTFTID